MKKAGVVARTFVMKTTLAARKAMGKKRNTESVRITEPVDGAHRTALPALRSAALAKSRREEGLALSAGSQGLVKRVSDAMDD